MRARAWNRLFMSFGTSLKGLRALHETRLIHNRVRRPGAEKIDNASGTNEQTETFTTATLIGVQDTFTGTAGTLLTAHAGEEATWARKTGTNDPVLTPAGRLRPDATAGRTGFFYTAENPGSADINATFDVVFLTDIAVDIYVLARYNIHLGTNGYYVGAGLRWGSTSQWITVAVDAGNPTGLFNSFDFAPSPPGHAYACEFRVSDDSLQFLVDTVLVHNVVYDNALPNIGLIGLYIKTTGAGVSDTTGYHLDNLIVNGVGVPIPRFTLGVHALDREGAYYVD